MKRKIYAVQIWFLDDDLQKSAEYLNNHFLYKTIKGCSQALITAYLYHIGIRNKKYYKYFFDKNRKDETMDKFFPLWPLQKAPSFSNFDSRQNKWTRKCIEHFDYVKMYLEILCDEYRFRFKKQIREMQILDWFENDVPSIKIPKANLSRIFLEWKVIDPKYRDKNIVIGYRNKYIDTIRNDGISIKDFTNRDIPDFLIEDADIEKNFQQKKWIE